MNPYRENAKPDEPTARERMAAEHEINEAKERSKTWLGVALITISAALIIGSMSTCSVIHSNNEERESNRTMKAEIYKACVNRSLDVTKCRGLVP